MINFGGEIWNEFMSFPMIHSLNSKWNNVKQRNARPWILCIFKFLNQLNSNVCKEPEEAQEMVSVAVIWNEMIENSYRSYWQKNRPSIYRHSFITRGEYNVWCLSFASYWYNPGNQRSDFVVFSYYCVWYKGMFVELHGAATKQR